MPQGSKRSLRRRALVISKHNLPILNDYECARLAKGTQQHPDGRIDGEAFLLREHDDFLSVNCIDFHDGDSRDDKIDDLRHLLDTLMENLRKSHLLAIFKVGDAITYVRGKTDDKRELTIKHEWEANNHSHCGVHGFEFGEIIIADLLAESVNSNPVTVIPAKL